MEVVCKAARVILNCRFAASITYHDSLNGFRSGRVTGTASLEVKLIKQVTAMMEEVLNTIFLDLFKVYEALEWSRFLEILEGYGVWPMELCLF